MAVGNLWGGECIALLAVIFIGTSGLGAQRWISLFGFHVQPSEFAKVGLIITLAAMLSAPNASTLWRAYLQSLGRCGRALELGVCTARPGHLPRIRGDHHWHAVLGQR
jgi:cell division protein FtsW (lipid II flippase)